jgi:hypothetical protein
MSALSYIHEAIQGKKASIAEKGRILELTKKDRY